MRDVFLVDDGEAVIVRSADTSDEIYRFSYRDKGLLIWNRDDAWRRLRKDHLQHDLYKERFKCQCGNLIKLPEKIGATIDEVNRIIINLECFCGQITKIVADILRVEGEVGK